MKRDDVVSIWDWTLMSLLASLLKVTKNTVDRRNGVILRETFCGEDKVGEEPTNEMADNCRFSAGL